MSPNMKLSVLALVGAAAAVPQYNVGHGHAAAHSKHFTPSAGSTGHAYPTGGWGAYNSTAPSAPAQGTGKPTKPTSLPAGDYTTSLPAGEKPSSLPAGQKPSSQPAGEKPTEVVSGYAAESDYTVTSTTTRTVYLTQYPTGSAPTAVNVKDVTSEAVCGGPSIVYVTETNRVTVTVPAGGASSTAEAVKPSVPAAKPSSSVPAAKPSSAPAASYEAATSFVFASSEAPKPSSAAYVSTPVAGAEAVTSSYAAASSAQQSSAAPAASSAAPAGGYTGGKRGLAYRWDGAADCKSFEGQNFGFAWNWEADTKGDIGSFAGSFIPTLRTLANAGEWAGKAQAAIEAGAKVLFGFNEPDIASQASMDVASLCSAWKDNMNPFYGKATIVGPSVSSSVEANQGLSYLQNFVESCPEAKFDDINIHWYGPASAGFSAFKSHYEDAASKFSGKKIWVSEFGLNGATAQESADFLKEAQTFLDGESSCAGYSYFAVGNFDPSANLIGTMSALTEAGKVYVS